MATTTIKKLDKKKNINWFNSWDTVDKVNEIIDSLTGASGTIDPTFGAITATSIAVGTVTITKANVTQATSETTAVTANGGAGVITGFVTSTAAGGSYVFTFNNSNIKTTSVIEISAGTQGNGIPYTFVSNRSAGSCVITVFNLHTSAAFNNAVLIDYTIL